MNAENPVDGEKPENHRPAEGVGPTERASQAGRVDFDRRELSALLRLFSSLGITVAAGITGCFWLGVWAERRLAGVGWEAGHWPRIVGLLLGLGLAGYWGYWRITGHLAEFEAGAGKARKQ